MTLHGFGNALVLLVMNLPQDNLLCHTNHPAHPPSVCLSVCSDFDMHRPLKLYNVPMQR